MALFKREVLVRHNSDKDFDGAMSWTLTWLNNLQNKDTNKDENGNYIDYYFADVTFAPGHANGGQVWRIYSDACEQKYDMTKDANTNRIEFIIANLAGVLDQIAQLQSKVTNNTAELSEHESRIEALENDDAADSVEATVI